MRTIKLQEMQRIEFDLLCIFDRVCQENRLRYYIDGGTLLGAMCYEDFIPWDDDIDLKMPREDYEKLLGLQGAFPSHVLIDAPRKEHCEYLFTKLIDSRTVLEESSGKKTGVYIDILPMDGHPNDPEECLRHMKKMRRYTSLFHYSLNGFGDLIEGTSFSNKIKGRIYSILYTPWRIYKKLTKEAKKYQYCDCKIVGLVIEGNIEKERFPKEWLEPPVKLLFHGGLFPAPNEYREHMRIFYGDHVVREECYHNLPQYPTQHNYTVYWKE